MSDNMLYCLQCTFSTLCLTLPSRSARKTRRAWQYAAKKAFKDWPSSAAKYPLLLSVVRRMESFESEDDVSGSDDEASASDNTRCVIQIFTCAAGWNAGATMGVERLVA